MPDQTERRPLFPIVWDALVLVVTILAAFAIPARVVLAPGQQPLSLAMDAALTALFGVDLVLRLRWRQSAGGSRAWNRWWLAVDVLSALPLGRALGLGSAALLRLIKLTHLLRYMGGWRRRRLLHPVAMRLGFFFFWMSLSAHWLACGWIYLGGSSSDLGTDSVYLGALYWCVTTLTTVGYGDITPSTPPQAIYTMVVMLLGVGVYGYVIGNVASLLSKLDSVQAQYVTTMERLEAFLRYRHVPEHLQHHIFDYYKYLWENRMGYDETSVLEDLPPTLRRELSLVLKRDLVKNVSFLRDASPELVQDLVLEMKAVVVTPGDLIVRAGELGRHIYFIGTGSVEVMAPDETTVLRTLSDGDFFGELALLHQRRRNATVRAVGYCDLYLLDQEAFDATLERYPDFAQDIREISEERTMTTETP